MTKGVNRIASLLDSGHDDDIALIEGRTGQITTYAELRSTANIFSREISSTSRRLVFAYLSNSISSLIHYCGLLRSNVVICLLDSSMPEKAKRSLENCYKPEYVVSESDEGIKVERAYRDSTPIDPNVCMLLATSGSTGNPKLVALSAENVISNALAITKYLQIDRDEIAPICLPISYSYGLSVVNSHLIAGAKLASIMHPLMDPRFWNEFASIRCTSFAGVPISYKVLSRIGFTSKNYPSLRYLTQAGGRLDTILIEQFHQYSIENSLKFYVMYGQTEATARMTYVPHEFLGGKIGSVGIPIPNGAIHLESPSGDAVPNGEQGEVYYSGPNVMKGYVESREGLERLRGGDGCLATGDLGYLDKDGYLWITGRIKRFTKINGYRFNLDDIERHLAAVTHCVAVSSNQGLTVFTERVEQEGEMMKLLLLNIRNEFGIPKNAVQVKFLDELPTLPSGKIDYKSLIGDNE